MRAVASNLKTLHFVSDKTAFHTLPFNKYLPHTEDKVLALKEINNLTGYSEKCQLPFKNPQSFQDVWVRLAIQKKPLMILCDATDVFLDRINQSNQAVFVIPLISHWHVGKTTKGIRSQNNNNTKTLPLLMALIKKSPQAMLESNGGGY